MTERLEEKPGTVVGRWPEPALLLLGPVSASSHRGRVSLDWELPAQGAQDVELITLAQECHPQTLRQMRWANAMLKTLSPQFLAS